MIKILQEQSYKIICGVCKKELDGHVIYPTISVNGLIAIMPHECNQGLIQKVEGE